MKRILLLIVVIATLASKPVDAAFAATDTPHIVVDGEVWLLNEMGEKIFLLPDSYYARINNLDDAYYYVTFNGVSGKVSKNVVGTTGYHTAATGTMCQLSIAPEYAEFAAIKLKCRPDLSASDVVEIPVEQPFTFLGEHPAADAVWYYVQYNQYYGYLKADRTTMPETDFPVFVPEEIPQEVVDPTDPAVEETDPPSGLDRRDLRIIVIVGLAVPAVAVIFLLFRPKGKRKRFYDE